ncbi:DUF3592 domain-containing protein [Devosia faecipullorum]|uniref:DUF3592 domain-containing protein n=1 Tax=Devosia faecipullorum TaxID=2755039 RepID=UPI00187B9895|nr:DUF3592 domain-containing protein [Devosia faecipullorum]MBE7732859.1 DUF3592 domain-containing protein [Devosia faecipullorum]
MNSGSALAGIEWPVSAYDWSDDPDGPRHGLLEQGAADLGMHCGAAREFNVWNLENEEDPEGFRTAILGRYEAAGWTLTEPVVVEPAVYLATRGAEQLVVWLNPIPEEFALALFSCKPQADPVSAADIVAAAPPEPTSSGRLPIVGEMGLGIIALGGLALFLGLWRRRKANAARNWAEVSALILKSEVQESEFMGDSPGEREIGYSPKVEYSYSYEGADYRSSRVHFGPAMTMDQQVADKIITQYPAGATVNARVNPAQPNEATLAVEPQPVGQFVTLPIIFAATGILLVVVAYTY